MIKHGRFFLVSLIHKLFNDILNSGIFPSQWNSGLIIPIYKNKGDPNLPSNYRGITLASCLGKLFTSLLQTRYMNYLEKHCKLNNEQFGFRRNSRTTDNLFILQQIIHRYFGKKEKVFACFIDYEKAFDTVWQKGLIHKLSKIGVKGKFLEVVNSMYKNINSCVQLNNNSYSDTFHCNKGIMQGDSLSPLLFTTYMNDIPEFLRESNCPGVNIGNTNINCLMFADDLILLSSTVDRLQKLMNALNTHAKKWRLKVNTNKTNAMVFCANGHRLYNYKFTYNNTTVETVDKQTYLGIVITPSGRFSHARMVLSNKARKTLGHIRSLISNCTNIPLSLLDKLFDSLVKPVLLYGSEIWGPELLSYKSEFDTSDIEQTHLKFCKQILNIPSYTANMKVRAELGRYPLSVDIKKQIASYYLRLKYNITNSTLKVAFQYSVCHSTPFQNIYEQMVELQNPLKNVGKPPSTKQEIKSIIKKTEKDIKKSYAQGYFNTLLDESSNNTDKISYGNMKKEYVMEKYLKVVNKPSHRVAISKFRLNAHRLRINLGCYENKGGPIPVEQRTCLYCKNNTIENEKHFILECKTYENTRNTFIKEFSIKFTQFSSLSEKEKTLAILNTEDKAMSNLVGKFLNEIYKQRCNVKK